ncbi:copper resistance protein B [Microbulbifer sp. MCCC 1A16149]|uniref:copper resistance protein B n=1 Tax=Microbulbifer sp. MCCC 1A16149 TaxID=3411322 RepID=UPI003D11CE8C
MNRKTLLVLALAAPLAHAAEDRHTQHPQSMQGDAHAAHQHMGHDYPVQQDASAPAAPNLRHAANEPDHVMDHEVLLTKVTFDQLEVREHDGGALEGSVWFGGDKHKAWFKTEVERAEGETEKAELQALYSRAIAPYWDLQMGVRHDFELESDSRNWGVIALNGLAPYFFEVDSSLFIGEDGDTALRVEAEYELLFTQQWILSPEIEMNFFGQNTPETHTGSGLSDVEAGLRLRYEFTPQFAPYIGVNYEKKFGNTADFARDDGEATSETTWVIGLHAWF